MTPDAFGRLLLDGLQEFDTAIPPLGLYASDELSPGKRLKARGYEWDRGLRPYL